MAFPSLMDSIRGIVPFSTGVPESTLNDMTGGSRNYSWLAGSFIAWLNQADAERQSEYRTYRDYYDGEHLYQLTERMLEFLELDANVKFDLNYLPLAIDVLAERLVVLGFSVKGEDPDDENKIGGADGLLAEWWEDNELDSEQDEIHLSALKDGDTYVLVGWDNEEGRPVITHEPAYDGDFGMTVRYHNDGSKKIRIAFKRWAVEEGEPTQRMNVYTPGSIMKFITTDGGWDAYIEEGDESWPLPWVDNEGMPLGVPVVHFKNKGAGGNFGKSELHDIVPAQDALNKMVLDEIAGADIEGFSMITLSGGRPPDETEIGPRKILYAPDGTWGEIRGGDLVALSDMVHNYIVRIAQISRTPLQYFQSTKQIASGETQQAYDTGIISKAENRSKHFGKAWSGAMKLGLKLDNVFGGAKHDLKELKGIKAVWGTFERVDRLDTEKRRADIVARLVESGAGLDGALFVAGYGKEEIERLLENAPLVAPIFLKAGGVGRAEQTLLGGDATAADMKGDDIGGDVASGTARAE